MRDYLRQYANTESGGLSDTPTMQSSDHQVCVERFQIRCVFRITLLLTVRPHNTHQNVPTCATTRKHRFGATA